MELFLKIITPIFAIAIIWGAVYVKQHTPPPKKDPLKLTDTLPLNKINLPTNVPAAASQNIFLHTDKNATLGTEVKK